ncbi:HNH endonuclease [Acidimicrobiia bacterium EGI L10123]|uniref:HNH endonuclease signature motif containing protein n=1 Tax=Salinilacustrithrix flava TaxID=2957203 RepID=UPI003D7C31AC|nr:HNH endonuclease [Acidimicrobiia bacterium EGI L10123]
MTDLLEPVGDLGDALDMLEVAVGMVQAADLDGLSPKEELALVGRVEKLRRRLDHGTDRTVAHLDASAAFSLDGHKTAKGALKAIGRLSGSEAHGRVQTSRALPRLPLVEAAYARGEIPTEHMRAMARTIANPRVAEWVPDADPIFAHHATVLGYDDFVAALRQWEALADADGADQAAERCHERRNASLQESAIDGSFRLEANHGGLQGAAMAEIFERFETAELHADWAAAREIHGDDARVEHLERTPAQRRADAIFEIFRRAAAAEGCSPEPLVNIVVDQETFEDELRRGAGVSVTVDPNEVLDRRRCHAMDGTPLRPAEAVAAALVGHVRRVVIDSAGTVIDLGRRQRLFTGSARDAAFLQALLRGPGGLGCLWPGCDGRGKNLQVDHRDPACRGGPTNTDNSDAYCGFHNRTKEHGFRPVRHPDGTWTIHRPDDDGPITPPV